MRIAVSGTHSVGKSTFVQDFIKAHPDYVAEDEPYRALCDQYDIKFGKKSTRFCNGIQLYHNISRVKQYTQPSCQVVFDRCPIDYIAYSLYTARHRQTDLNLAFVNSLIEPVREALQFLDVILFVPLSEAHPVALEDDGIRPVDASYRNDVDQFFKQIYFDRLYQLMPKIRPPVLLELCGPRQERIDQITTLLMA